MKELKVFKEMEALSREGAEIIVEIMEEKVLKQGVVSLFLAGGSTPKRCYQILGNLLAERNFPLERAQWFWGDERWVPAEHEESNERMVRENLLNPLGAPEGTVYPWNAGIGLPEKNAAAYNGFLEKCFTQEDRVPDIVLLGMGDDGHTLSLFPGSSYITSTGELVPIHPEMSELAVAVDVDKLNTRRLSLTASFVNSAEQVIFFLSGEKKKTLFPEVYNGNKDYPAAWIQGKRTLFLITEDVRGN